MGDHRATVKISFSMHGVDAENEWWINWSPDDTGVDRRSGVVTINKRLFCRHVNVRV